MSEEGGRETEFSGAKVREIKGIYCEIVEAEVRPVIGEIQLMLYDEGGYVKRGRSDLDEHE